MDYLRAGQLSELHVFKIARRSKLCEEQRNIEKYVSVIDSVPNVVLYPRVPLGAGDDELGLLRQRFAGGSTGRAISLRQFLMNIDSCADSSTAASVMGQLYEQNLAGWHGESLQSRQIPFLEHFSNDSLGRDLWRWQGKIDLVQAADEIGTKALDASLKERTGLGLEEVIQEVARISNLRFRKRVAIIHGDLHAQNVLVDSEQKLHIIDFGSTGIGWAVADFLMMECALKFTTSHPNSVLKDILKIDEVAEQQWGSHTAVFADDLKNRLYGRSLSIIAAAVCTVRRFAERYRVIASPEEYRAGLILLSAAMASYPKLVNRNYVFHSLAQQIKRLHLQVPTVSHHERVRCVGLFGPSGSGKTTLAEGIAKRYATTVVVEAFPDIIEPILSQRLGCSPEIAEAVRLHATAGRLARTVSLPLRRRSRDLFRRFSNEMGEAWLAHRLEEWRATTYPDRLVVVSGLRGVETAKALKTAGWLVTYLTAPTELLVQRQATRDGLTLDAAMTDHVEEENLYHTTDIDKIADLIVDVASNDEPDVLDKVDPALSFTECKKCVNTDFNPWVKFSRSGKCQTCADYEERWSRQQLDEEIDKLNGIIAQQTGAYDAMIGMSGGKDSTAAAWYLKEERGLRVLGFTFDTGYYPDSIVHRAREAAELIGIDHDVIDIREYIGDEIRDCYRETARVFDSLEKYDRKELLEMYIKGRQHYKTSDLTVLPFLRTCQLCRKTVIRAYYGEANKRNIAVVFLGMNEWVGLSAQAAHGSHPFAGVRKLQPTLNKSPVYIAHLRYLLGTTLADVKTILQSLGWKTPTNEDFVETNSNSCLLAAAAEFPLRKALGFHPDSTRLAREVTAGFLSKEEAVAVLNKRRVPNSTVREVLEKAGII